MDGSLSLYLAALLFLIGVEKTYQQAPLFTSGPNVVANAVPYDGGNIQLQLDYSFSYFHNQYTQLYLGMDGFLSPLALSYDDYVPGLQADVIAPLWSDIDNYNGGQVSYEQATSGPLLQQATTEMSRVYPGFTATWVLVCTWSAMQYESYTGVMTFQVVLIIDNEGSSFIMMNYGPIASGPTSYLAGYQTQDNSHNFAIQTPSTSALSTSTNVGIPGRWIFQVAGQTYGVFFPDQPSTIHNAVTNDGGFVQIQLSQPFFYFGTAYTQMFLSMDGFLSFAFLESDGYLGGVIGQDFIAPLWTDIDTDTSGGDISYNQVTSGPLLQLATNEINRIFPGSSFNASWVFVGTWDQVEFEGNTGPVSFQVVLITDVKGTSYVLMNYGPIPDDPQPWMAGYQTQDNLNNFGIQSSSTSGLPQSTNAGMSGRWAFRVNDLPSIFFPVLPSAVQHAVSIDGDSTPIQLEQPFFYFDNQYSQIYLSIDGFLSFVVISSDGSPSWSDLNQDVIAPLWIDVDIDGDPNGDISYEQATSGPLLTLATKEINRMFPNLTFTASWVLVATWNNVEFEYEYSTTLANFQVVLIADDDGDASFVLMNYGSIPHDYSFWMAGYQTQNHANGYRINVPSVTGLTTSTNVGIPGRWAFRVDACGTLNCYATEVCMARSGIYGCGCSPSYPVLNPNNFDATETCSGSSASMSLSRCQLFEAGFSVQSLHLNDATCKGTVEDGTVTFSYDNHNCGTTLQHNSTHFMYENSVQMFSDVEPKGVVSRDTWLNITFSCVYPLVKSISMATSVQATGSTVSKSLSTTGTYQIFMAPYPNASFIAPASGNMIVEVNSQVYVSVEVDGFDSSQIATVLDSCWATPDSNINNPLRWDLITNECPNPEDGTVQVLQNGISTSSRFSFKMFTFTGTSSNINLHCKVHLCLVEGGECVQSCVDADGDGDEVPGGARKRRSLDFQDTALISMSF